MKIVQLTLVGLCGLALACGDSSGSSSDDAYGDMPSVDVPTEEEAEADAAAAINEANADEEFDKLSAEIEADG